MAATQREFRVRQPMDQVWDFVSDMGNWAEQMPGYVSHEIINEVDSAWTLEVDIGPFQRSIVVDVHVLRWGSPSTVDFTVKGRYEPFSGGGTYRSEPVGEDTRIELAFSAEPSGSMARMISPLVGPVLERIADQFSTNLGNALGGALEQEKTTVDEEQAVPSMLQRLKRRLVALLRSLIGKG